MANDVKWIKLSTGIFNNGNILQLETMPDGDSLIVIWLKLLCLAGIKNDNGLVYFTQDIPYTDDMLANYFHRPLNTVRLALDVFQRFEMITIVDSIIEITNWARYQSADKLAEMKLQALEDMQAKNAARQARFRAKKKAEAEALLAAPKEPESNVTQTLYNALRREEDKEKNKSKSKKEKKLPHGPHGLVTLTPSEMQAFIVDEGEERTLAAIERLDAYMNDYGKKYQSCAAALRRWAFRAVDEDNARQARSAKSAPAACNVKQYDFGDEADVAALIDKI